ncbi:resuscitation-promoting factor [Cellulomonas telluris]|uniref:resuscitation-promoting factor n=1 Tax=Cellulomonas telluris TaxID=2306636 RepID=UPI001FEC748D|nr:resuscitation-promoting factor [Cellulomonas telluris]
MPGHHDGWSTVQFSTRFLGPNPRTAGDPAAPADAPTTDPGPEQGPTARAAATAPTPAVTDGPEPVLPDAAAPAPRRRRWLAVTGAAAALVLGAGTAGYAHAHKSVVLDVDGETREVSTFAGSVEGLLEDEGVAVGTRDTVSASGALTDGLEVVVRHATAVTVTLDGEQQVVWTTALSAEEALETLATRAGTVALVASRSSAAGRPELPLDLALRGPAEVHVDGTVLTVPDADASVADVLGELGVTLQPLDRVQVVRGQDGRVDVLVQRVVVQDVATTHEVPFTSRTQEDASLYTGERTVAQAGAPGVRTVVDRVTTVDGVEETRVPVSDEVTQAPVEEVVSVGTKARPAPKPAARPASPAAPAAGGTPGPIAAGGSADSLNWAALARCESGGRVDAVSSTGKYHGLYQFSVATWQSVGGAGLPSQASADEQTARAKMLYNRSGAGQWPHCGKNLFS